MTEAISIANHWQELSKHYVTNHVFINYNILRLWQAVLANKGLGHLIMWLPPSPIFTTPVVFWSSSKVQRGRCARNVEIAPQGFHSHPNGCRASAATSARVQSFSPSTLLVPHAPNCWLAIPVLSCTLKWIYVEGNKNPLRIIPMVWYSSIFNAGWSFFATPTKNDGLRQLGWWHFQYMEIIKAMFQSPPTRIWIISLETRGDSMIFMGHQHIF